MSDDIVIKVEGLSKSYQIYDVPRNRLLQALFRGRKRFYREFSAVNDVSFLACKGDTIGVIGRNGSGKSTLLQLICGILNPSSGNINVQGRIAALLELGSGFNPEFNGRDNIYLNASLLGLKRVEIDERYEQIAAFADIGDFINHPIKTYSSGMVMRLAFAVSVCVDPDILIVDEALAVGDVAFQFKCMDRLRRLSESGTTLLFVSHDMGMIKSFCNHVLYLDKGRIKASGAPDEMAEIYALDMRDEQRRASPGVGRVTYKPFLGAGKGIAFGTEEGFILSAVFENTQSYHSTYTFLDEVVVNVALKVRESVINPSLSVLVLDRRMIDISGAFFMITEREATDGWIYCEMVVRWPAALSGGGYSVTLRLESREDERNFQPIDKQVGVLTFEVIDKGNSFLGVFDLNMRGYSTAYSGNTR